MAKKFYDKQHLKFLLFELFKVDQLCEYSYYEEHNRETLEMVIDAAEELSEKHLKPYLEEMDRNEPYLKEGEVVVHEKVKDIINAFAEGGWLSAVFPFKDEGQQLPHMLSFAASFIFSAANYSGSVYSYLTTGAANLIRAFGSQALKEQFIPKMLEGSWQGTMALTEPEAGSSLSDITTTAYATSSDFFLLKGQKIFISAGDHNGVENIVHLMLARTEGAPKGVKGISLFVVPKKRLEEGKLISNDVKTVGVFHKMGYIGAPIVHLMLGENEDCRAYLVGEENKGLLYMFQLMNEARIGVGLNATSIASAAYHASLEYAKERKQGRSVANKQIEEEQVDILKHADIKRMLLFQKSIVEGSLSLLMQCAYYTDILKVAEGEEYEKASLLLDLLTPIAKSYPSEKGCLTTSAALQIHGGYGYCKDFPVEQFYREARIHPIHEGTTGIHAIDLLGRKIWLEQSKGYQYLLEEIKVTIEQAREYELLSNYAVSLKQKLQLLENTTKVLHKTFRHEGAEAMLADATLYLELLGTISIAWQWLKIGIKASEKLTTKLKDSDKAFYEGKIYTLYYYYEYELPNTIVLSQRLCDDDRLTLYVEDRHF
ncbi:acyl-CoA dehydrogenase [Chondrinema litorale]|uniref:acyl-CoA dehydrogenase n=1 Tax=Chondrinema litorale TaxID=2994555 RepID=UPI002542D385|nr:acyl-CoA dehydrogenase [Chondrinema litorale]UZR95545.1 acyl-CoA dehydrogenase [Chondrinema litorale]